MLWAGNVGCWPTPTRHTPRGSGPGRTGTAFDAESYAEQVLRDLPIESLDVHDPAIVSSVRHLRQVVELSCSVPETGQLDFVPAQVTKLHLLVSSGVQLSTLRTPGLEELTVSGGRFIDVQPLVMLPRLTSFTSIGARFRHLAELGEVPMLTRVEVRGGCRVEDLGMFPPGWSLEALTLGHVDGLTTLASLNFVRGLRELRMEDCSRLRRLDGVGRWAESLETLALRRCSPVDLSPLMPLVSLVELDLLGSMVGDLTPLTRLPRLERLTVSSSRTARDLATVARIPRLRELRITQGGPVNLAGLASVRDLTIKIEDGTATTGTEKLDAGTRIERWDGK